MIDKGSSAKILVALALSAMVIAITGCGTDNQNTAPFGSSITINPSKVTTDGPSGACTGFYQDSLFKITVLGPDKLPMNDAAITIALSWAPNYAHPAIWSMQLYDMDTVGGAAVTVPYQTKTGDFGTKNVMVRHDITCDYKGQLEVFSGTAYLQVDIEVN